MKGKECMAVNNPTGFKDVLFNKAMDAYEENVEHVYKNPFPKEEFEGVDLSRGPDMTRTTKNENWRSARVANTTYGLNVRSEPSVDAKLVCVINNSDDFDVSALRTPDWYKVKLKDGTVGFVSSKYVSVIGG